MFVFQLDDLLYFPNPKYAQKGGQYDGLLAYGGDLRVERLCLAYRQGIFPWYNDNTPILWWCPHERFIIRPDKIHVSHSMRKFLKKHEIEVVYNRDFPETIHKCRILREFGVGTWITDDMEKAYCEMFEKGFAMNVMAYVDGELAGGLYGVNLGKCFFGESMFSVKENGSKIALIHLAQKLQSEGYTMIDCQFHTEHLESMGGERITYEEYVALLNLGEVGRKR